MSKIVLDEWQTVKNLIRCHILWHLRWVCTVCSGLSVSIFRVSIVMQNFYWAELLNSNKNLAGKHKHSSFCFDMTISFVRKTIVKLVYG